MCDAEITSATKDEYLQKINQIKEDPAIREFLQKHRDSISVYGLLHEKLKAIFIDILQTAEGQKTLIHVCTEMETILTDKNVLKMIQTILSTFEYILTSEQGSKSAVALAEYLKSALTVHSLFELLASAKKFILYLFISQDGLTSAILMKENEKKWLDNPSYVIFDKVINEQFTLIQAPLN